jgi:hypothetical protein
MKKTYLIIVVSLVCVLAHTAFGGELTKGRIVSPISHDRINLTVGDNLLTTLGREDGVTKGDILRLTTSTDAYFVDPIGTCAVIKTINSSSICEVLTARTELLRGNVIFMDALRTTERPFYLPILDVLGVVVEPYAPHKKIRVYIHNIFDEKNNVTDFSERFREEMKAIFSQKDKIVLAGEDAGREIMFYPDEYHDVGKTVRRLMINANVDVLITGRYTVEKGNINLSILKIDKNFIDQQIELTLPADGYKDRLASLIRPYKPLERKGFSVCTVIYDPHYTVLQKKDEKKQLIRYESQGNPFIEYTLGRIDFNIISPVQVSLKIDDDVVAKDGKMETKLMLRKGSHRASISFRRGYFSTVTQEPLYVSSEVIAKDFILNLEKDGDVTIEMRMDPTYNGNNFDIKVYKTVDKERYVVKPVYAKERQKTVEAFKD